MFLSINSLFKNTLLFLFLPFISCGSEIAKKPKAVHATVVDSASSSKKTPPLLIGAQQVEAYLSILKGKKIAVVGNQTSCIKTKNSTKETYTHLVDTLLKHQITITKVFAPEHGFRGKVDAGETVLDGKDTKTGLPIISLYGKNKKPSAEVLAGIETIVFDIQDVGARFYTYISTLHYVMQACAENNINLLILDRPNPNGHYVDGPTLEIAHQSFVGIHPIPLVHGMTIGEYAKMVNGEGWLGGNLHCDLTIIPLKNYTHTTAYHIPIKPSPNLPNDIAINLYPSLGFFEGTTINAGRGTELQFQIFGAPDLPKEHFSYRYIPQPNDGAKNPKHKGVPCNGKDLRTTPKMSRVDLTWLIEAYQNCTKKDKFFKKASFTIHAGSTKLQQQIQQGLSADQIHASWQEDLEKFKKVRSRYLLYK